MSSTRGRRFTDMTRRLEDPDDGRRPVSGEDPLVTAARAGDEAAFGALAERHRRELHVHCYRMLASFEEAEDAVQETYLGGGPPRGRLGRGATLRPGVTRSPTSGSLDAI